MLLRSFSFESLNQIDPIIYLIFRGENIEKAGDHVLEIIDAIHRGTAGVNLDKIIEAVSNDDEEAFKRVFNIEAYVNTIKKNQRLVKNAESKKMLHISNVDDDGVVEPYGVPESVVTSYTEQKDEYEELIDKDEVMYAVDQLNRRRMDILIEHRMDVVVCIKQALRGIPESLASLKRLVVDEPQIGDLIKIVLSSGQPFNELFQAA